jgi:hypothetical protein
VVEALVPLVVMLLQALSVAQVVLVLHLVFQEHLLLAEAVEVVLTRLMLLRVQAQVAQAVAVEVAMEQLLV